MRIIIERFGPISRFEYDLTKDIVVTYGDNNIGKSYAMQLVYLLIKSFGDSFLMRRSTISGAYYYFYDTPRITLKSKNFLHETVTQFAEKKEFSHDITGVINDCILTEIKENIIIGLTHSCENTFGNFKGIIAQDPKITVEIADLHFVFCFSEKGDEQSTIYTYPTYLKKTSSDFHKQRNANNRLDIYYNNNIDTTTSTILDVINERINDIIRKLHDRIGTVYFLPASRSGIYSGMSAFSSIIAQLSQSKTMLTKKIELPGISEPISDYFLMINSISSRENERLSSVYGKIERDILKGTVKYNKSRNSLVYYPTGIKYEFDMTEVSSMVSEISPIVATLKYIVNVAPLNRKGIAKPIVFIEEPEAHLHPQNQIKLIEIFAELHKLGIKLVISSHSNYIFNKLNNLLLKKTITPDDYSAIILQAHPNGSISEFMNMDELGVDDTNFLDVATELLNERDQLIENWCE